MLPWSYRALLVRKQTCDIVHQHIQGSATHVGAYVRRLADLPNSIYQHIKKEQSAVFYLY